MKPRLSFYTNMPTPYQLDFFDALKEYFELKVVYFTTREVNRQWDLSTSHGGYSTQVLKNNRLALIVQKKFPSFHFSNEIRSVVKKDSSDFVIINGTYWSPNVLIALKMSTRYNKKVAFWGEPVFESHGLSFHLKKFMLAPIRKYTDFLFAIGSKAESTYRNYGYKKDIYQLPYNIDFRVFDLDNLEKNTVRNLQTRYKNSGETVLLSSGSLIRRKGMDTVVEAFRKLPAETNARLLIIGDGPEKETLVQLAGDDERIHFLGFQSKEMMPYWFHLSDIFVFASHYDGWALVINEAIAGKNAIISNSTVGAANDYIIDGTNGFLMEAGDTAGFAQKMSILIHDKELREHFVANSDHARLQLSSEYNAKKVYEVYRHTQ